jgi:hypothetical protein
MKECRGVYVGIRVFLTLALVADESPTSRLDYFTRKRQGPRYSLDKRLGGAQSRYGQLKERTFFTFLELQLLPLCRPTRNQ